MPRLIVLVILAFSLLTGSPARAAQDRRAELKTLSDRVLSTVTGLADQGEWKAVTTGETLIEDSGAYYAITLPRLSFRGADGRVLDIGLIALNAVPGATRDEWKMTAALPTPLVMTDSSGAKIMTIAIGRQNFSGIYSVSQSGFTRLNARYGDVTAQYTPLGLKITLPSVEALGEFQPKGGGRSGTTELTLLNPAADFMKTGARMTLARLSLVTDSDEATTARMKALRGKLDSAAQDGHGAFAGLLPDLLGLASRGSMTSLSASALKLILPGPSPQTIQASALNANLKAGDGGPGMAQIGFSGGFSGLAYSPAQGDLHTALPSDLNFNLDVANLPVDKIVAADMQKPGTLAALLSESRTTAILSDGRASNASWAMAASGAQTSDASAPLGMTGNATIRASGLEKLSGALISLAAKPSTPGELKPYLRDVLAAAMVMQLTGKAAKDGKGNPVKEWVLSNGEDGKVILNGQDMQALMNVMPKTEK